MPMKVRGIRSAGDGIISGCESNDRGALSKLGSSGRVLKMAPNCCAISPAPPQTFFNVILTKHLELISSGKYYVM